MNKKEDNNFLDKCNMKWVIMITIWTFIMAIVFSIITEGLVKNLNIFAFILIIIIVIGIF